MKTPLRVLASAVGLAACGPMVTPSTSPTEAALARPDPRDVTRPGLAPPRYRAGSKGPLEPITTNGYGAYADAPHAPQLGDVAPDFELPLARGGSFSLAQARTRGPVVIVFYRGFW